MHPFPCLATTIWGHDLIIPYETETMRARLVSRASESHGGRLRWQCARLAVSTRRRRRRWPATHTGAESESWILFHHPTDYRRRDALRLGLQPAADDDGVDKLVYTKVICFRRRRPERWLWSINRIMTEQWKWWRRLRVGRMVLQTVLSVYPCLIYSVEV